MEKTKQTCEELNLSGLVLIGSHLTLSDSLDLNEYFLQEGVTTKVCAVPTVVDGNITHPLLEANLGFDTASKVYSQLIGNIMTDAASCKKYWYFMRLMGRETSHLVLECALQTKPNCTIISEDFESRDNTLNDVVDYICDIVCARAEKKKNFGTVLIPEGLLTHLPYLKRLIGEIDQVFKGKTAEEQHRLSIELFNDQAKVKEVLTPWSAAILESLPDFTRRQLLLERETGGGVQLSQIETEKLLASLVGKELKKRKAEGRYKGSFSPVTHFFGYQGRCSLPSQFDCQLGSTYGYTAGVLITAGYTGYCVSARNLVAPAKDWVPAAIPLISMIGKSTESSKLHIPSSQVDLKSKAFKEFSKLYKQWIHADTYANPGPIQFEGEPVVNITTKLKQREYVSLLDDVTHLCNDIGKMCQFGVQDEVLRIAISNLAALRDTIALVKDKLEEN